MSEFARAYWEKQRAERAPLEAAIHMADDIAAMKADIIRMREDTTRLRQTAAAEDRAATAAQVVYLSRTGADVTLEERCRLLEATPAGRPAAQRLRREAARKEAERVDMSVLSSPHEQGLRDGIEAALKLYGTCRQPGADRLAALASEGWQRTISGRDLALVGSEEPAHYREGFLTGFGQAWAHQAGEGGDGQDVPAELREAARQHLLSMTPAGRETLKKERATGTRR